MKILTRRDAIRIGQNIYYIKPCTKGHTDGRFVSNSKCIKCNELKKSSKSKDIINEMKITKKESKKNQVSQMIKNSTKPINGYVLIAGVYCKKQDRLKKIKAFKDIKSPLVKKARSDLAILIGRIKRNSKLDIVSNLGYSARQLKNHLEKSFEHGMNFNNMGKWHIDHIIPVYKYTLSNGDYSEDGFSKLVNDMNNLQPLWAIDNHKKSCKF